MMGTTKSFGKSTILSFYNVEIPIRSIGGLGSIYLVLLR